MILSLQRAHAMPAALRNSPPVPLTPSVPAAHGWELVGLLGEGRWAGVYSARMPGTAAADYAIKLAKPLPPARESPLHAQSLAMLRREAQIGSTVSHPNLVPVLDWQLGGEPFIVMPRIEGCTLGKILEHRRREYGCRIGGAKFLPQSVWVARQVAAALAALHSAGWLHGDVNSENVLVAPRGHTMLIDLGLARKLDSRECQGGAVLAGTLAYVSPETFLPAAALCAASDVYSLGALLHELLTGQPMFAETDPTRLALLHLREAPPDVREAALEVPPALARLVMRMLAKEPLRRPAAGEVVRQLTRLEIELLASA